MSAESGLSTPDQKIECQALPTNRIGDVETTDAQSGNGYIEATGGKGDIESTNKNGDIETHYKEPEAKRQFPDDGPINACEEAKDDQPGTAHRDEVCSAGISPNQNDSCDPFHCQALPTNRIGDVETTDAQSGNGYIEATGGKGDIESTNKNGDIETHYKEPEAKRQFPDDGPINACEEAKDDQPGTAQGDEVCGAGISPNQNDSYDPFHCQALPTNRIGDVETTDAQSGNGYIEATGGKGDIESTNRNGDSETHYKEQEAKRQCSDDGPINAHEKVKDDQPGTAHRDEVCGAGISPNQNDSYDPFHTEVVALDQLDNILDFKAVHDDHGRQDTQRENDPEDNRDLIQVIDDVLGTDFAVSQMPFQTILVASNEPGVSTEPDAQNSERLFDFNASRIFFQYFPNENRVLHHTSEDDECDEEVAALLTASILPDMEEHFGALDFN